MDTITTNIDSLQMFLFGCKAVLGVIVFSAVYSFIADHLWK